MRQGSVVENGDRYKVILFFNDDLSSVKWGTIKQDGRTLKTFSENIASFNITTPWIVNVVAKDSFGNELIDTVDIRDYIDWYDIPEEIIESDDSDKPIQEPQWDWEKIKNAISNCEVESVFQAHSLSVIVSLKNWEGISGIEPNIDDIINLVHESEGKCGEVMIATE
jgi:hypothetical protein